MVLTSEDITGNCRHYNVISSIVANESQGYLWLTLNSIDFSLKTLILFCKWLSLCNSFWNQRFMYEMGTPSLTWFSALVPYTDPENPNMMHTREDAIRSGKCSDLGQKTVGIQVPVSNIGKKDGIITVEWLTLIPFKFLKTVIINAYFDWPSLICHL